MKPLTFVGPGSIRHLGEVLSSFRAHGVFLVCGRRSFSLSGAEVAVASAMSDRRLDRFSDFSENPKLEDVQRGIERLRATDSDLVLAVGGGSAIDMAKLINVWAEAGARGPVRPGRPLIAVPTTAGTGSEATSFATVYIDGLKHSIAGEELLPDVAIVDPDLTLSLPAYVTAASGIDALSQAIESYWSVNSTPESKACAREALRLVLPHLREAVLAPSEESRGAMALGAHLAGKAINVSRTTAPHALSYALTSRFGVPHGQAVGLTLPEILLFNAAVTDEDTKDPRGARHVREAIAEICGLLGCSGPLQAADWLRVLMSDVGLATSFAGLGIDRQDAIRAMAAEVNAERLANNPRRLDQDQLLRLLEGL